MVDTSQVIMFVLVVGIGATAVLDIWEFISEKIGWMPRNSWPTVGRWVLGIFKGNLVLDSSDTSAHTGTEVRVGWLFHYLVGIAYAAMLPIFWGTAYVLAPTFTPALIVGTIVPLLAAAFILLPGLGAGIFGQKLPNAGAVRLFLLVSFLIYAGAIYLIAKLVA